MSIQTLAFLRQQLQLYLVRSGLFISSRLAPPLTRHWATRLFARPIGPRKIRYDFSKYPQFQEIKLNFQASYPAQTQRLHGYTWGRVDDRPTVLLVHGWGGWGLQLGSFVQPLLEHGFAVIAIDMPAHGHSSGKMATFSTWSDALTTLMQHFPSIQMTICHSFGGMVMAHTLTHHALAREQIRRMVLLGALADLQTPLHSFGRTMRLNKRMLQSIQRNWEKKFSIRLTALNIEATHHLADLPILLIHDEQDEVVGIGEFKRYQKHWPHADTLITKKLGHQHTLRDPKVIRQVIRFLSAASK